MTTNRWAVVYGILGLIVLTFGLSPRYLGLGGDSSTHLLVDFSVNLVTGFGLLYGAYWHWNRDLPAHHYTQIALWILGVTVLLVSLGTITLFLGSSLVLQHELLEVVQLNLGFGLLMGLLIGTIRSLSEQNTRIAAHAEAKAEAIEDEQKRLAELNGLLRHYILNAINVVEGHAHLIANSETDDHEQSAASIRNKAQNITEIIENLEWLSDLGPTRVQSIDLEQSIRHATRRGVDDPTISLELPTSDLQIRANSSITKAISILCGVLSSATEPGGTISITIERQGREAIVRAEGHPAALPNEVQHSMFEPIATGIGLKLFIADKIIDQFGELSCPSESQGSLVFECRLPLAESSI